MRVERVSQYLDTLKRALGNTIPEGKARVQAIGFPLFGNRMQFSGADRIGSPGKICTMFHQLYYHIVWTTRDRRPTISRAIADFLERLFRGISKQERTHVIALGMVTTHVHLLVRAHPLTVIPRLLQRLKGATSTLANKELGLSQEKKLKWAQGYTIQSISPRSLASVQEYVLNQARRHPFEAIAGWIPASPMKLDGPDFEADVPGCLEEHRDVRAERESG